MHKRVFQENANNYCLEIIPTRDFKRSNHYFVNCLKQKMGKIIGFVFEIVLSLSRVGVLYKLSYFLPFKCIY